MLGRGVGTAPRGDAHSPRRHSRSTGTPPSQRRHEAQVRDFSRSPASAGVDGALSKQPSPALPQPAPGTARQTVRPWTFVSPLTCPRPGAVPP